MDYRVRSYSSPPSLIVWLLRLWVRSYIFVTDKNPAHLTSVWVVTENSTSGFFTEGVAHQAVNKVGKCPNKQFRQYW